MNRVLRTWINTEDLNRGERRENANEKRYHVSERSDSDGDSSFAESRSHSFRHRFHYTGSSPGRQHDEGVVDSDTCKQLDRSVRLIGSSVMLLGCKLIWTREKKKKKRKENTMWHSWVIVGAICRRKHPFGRYKNDHSAISVITRRQLMRRVNQNGWFIRDSACLHLDDDL